MCVTCFSLDVHLSICLRVDGLRDILNTMKRISTTWYFPYDLIVSISLVVTGNRGAITLEHGGSRIQEGKGTILRETTSDFKSVPVTFEKWSSGPELTETTSKKTFH